MNFIEFSSRFSYHAIFYIEYDRTLLIQKITLNEALSEGGRRLHQPLEKKGL